MASITPMSYPISYPGHYSRLDADVVSLEYNWAKVSKFIKRAKNYEKLKFFIPNVSTQVIICTFLDGHLFIKNPEFERNYRYKNIINEVIKIAQKQDVTPILVNSNTLTPKLMREALLVHSVTQIM